MDPLRVRFTAFSNYEPGPLARLLSGFVIDNWPQLRPDFPSLSRRYGTPAVAQESVLGVIEAVRASEGTYGAFVVEINGEPLGVATVSQVRLHQWGWRWRVVPWRYCIADGPLLAIWLANKSRPRDGETRRILPAILREAADLLKGMNRLHGHPFTFVRDHRPDAGHVADCLADKHNGFGGFSPSDPADYSRVDDVSAPRRLWTANRLVQFSCTK